MTEDVPWSLVQLYLQCTHLFATNQPFATLQFVPVTAVVSIQHTVHITPHPRCARSRVYTSLFFVLTRKIENNLCAFCALRKQRKLLGCLVQMAKQAAVSPITKSLYSTTSTAVSPIMLSAILDNTPNKLTWCIGALGCLGIFICNFGDNIG